MNYAMQAIALYKESEVASSLKMRDHKDATDLIVRGGGEESMSEPAYMSDRKGHNGVTTDGIGTTLTFQEKDRPIIAMEMMNNATARNPILRILSETYGTQAIFQWGIAILDRVQQAEVLQQGMHESGIQSKAEVGDKLDDNPLPRPELAAEWLLRDMRERNKCGCASQGHEPAEQQPGQSATPMPELPHESTQAAKCLLDMWCKGEGAWLLRQALSEIQTIWRSAHGERTEGGDAMTSVVRRLTPLE
jgi:hypothetical protein